MAKYVVTEVQVGQDGVAGTISNVYDNENSANAQYHQVLAAAAVSGLATHSAVMYTDEGFFLKGECFKHDPVPAAEPATEE